MLDIVYAMRPFYGLSGWELKNAFFLSRGRLQDGDRPSGISQPASVATLTQVFFLSGEPLIPEGRTPSSPGYIDPANNDVRGVQRRSRWTTTTSHATLQPNCHPSTSLDDCH
jgi:hypothetical protein